MNPSLAGSGEEKDRKRAEKVIKALWAAKALQATGRAIRFFA